MTEYNLRYVVGGKEPKGDTVNIITDDTQKKEKN